MNSVGNIFDDYEKRQKAGGKHYIAAAFCAVMIIATIIVSSIIANNKSVSETVLPKFTSAMESGDYSEALGIYRDLHNVVVSADPDEVDKYQEQIATMEEMEQIVSERLSLIETRVRNERYTLNLEDQKFMNDMGELTSSQISDWLYSLCTEFLLGTIEKPDVVFIFSQMSEIGNVSATAGPLLREVETIEVARGDVQSAESSYQSGDYINAVFSYQGVVSNYSGFVYDFSNRRIDEIKTIMYDPMLEEGEWMLDTLKYYSAEQLFSDLAVIFPDDDRINANLLEATAHTSLTSTYYGTVEVLCIRQIIPEIQDNGSYVGSDASMYLTANQFQIMLEELYSNDYILVNPLDLIGMNDDSFLVEQNLIVPEGKKPLVIVIENLDYSASTYNLGTCHRLVTNEQGQVCGEYVDSVGQTIVSRNAEAIGILDAFVESYPDFSYNGVKGVISISGYESCFGYVVSEDEIDDRSGALSSMGYPIPSFDDADLITAQDNVRNIASILTNNGWLFASSTYGNINANDSDMNTIVSDTTKWMEQIEPLLGDVCMIVYPGGNYINGSDERAVYLKNNGFRVFYGIGSLPYYTYGSNYLYFDRAIINMNTLQNYDYSRLFNSQVIIESR